MAFNWQTFRTRALTALVFVVVMLAGLLWNRWSFLVLFSVIHFGCWWEYFRLLEKIYTTLFHIYTKLGLMLIGYGLLLWCCGSLYTVAGYGLRENFSLPVSAAGFVMLVLGIFQKNKIDAKSLGAAATGVLYISLSWGLMMNLYDTPLSYYANGSFAAEAREVTKWPIPVMVIALIWINDTMAYLVGSVAGRTPLSKISPKKTWEGTIGGIILAVVTAGLVAWGVGGFHIIHVAITAAIAVIAGTFGDLLESKLKRRAGVKDSGSLMPGHGGFLDRFDSLLLATPFVWLYVYVFMT